jgi:hypothetical protein
MRSYFERSRSMIVNDPAASSSRSRFDGDVWMRRPGEYRDSVKKNR